MAEDSRREKDLSLVDDFETVRAITSDGRSVRVPKSKFGGNLEVASESVLGGVKVPKRTDASKYNTPVQIDPSTGNLYVPEGEGNPPDEEDITLSEIDGVNKLRFKDKKYNKASFSGSGRCYLRKNVSSSKNILTQAMFTNEDGSVKSNTRYIIQYDYDLNGKEISIPANCTLIFEGGSFSNGIINCNKSFIIGQDDCLFCTVKGKLTNDKLPITWFGAKPYVDSVVSSHNEITMAVQSAANTGVPAFVPAGTFYCNGLILPEGAAIKGESINKSILRTPNSASMKANTITIINNSCEVSNITIEGNGRYEPYHGDTYTDEQGSGICICSGTRFGATNKECTNVKIYDIIIQKCGNNGLAIIDNNKWVYNFHNVTIKTCGNIGFLDCSTDNNFVGFNISHCENVGLYIKGSRNRYSTFKVFVCATKYKGNDGGTKPTGIYWQGVRIEGSHNALNGFDVQEIGGELLYIGSNARCNYIQASLDHPAFANSTSIGSFKPYAIYGLANYIILSLTTYSNYNQLDGIVSGSNEVIITSDTGAYYRIEKAGFLPQETSFGQSSATGFISGSTYITEEDSSQYFEFDGTKAKLLKQIDLPVGLLEQKKEKSYAFRIYDTRTDKSVRKDSVFYLVFNPYQTLRCNVIFLSQSFTLEVYDGTTNTQMYINAPLSEYADVYWTISRGKMFVMIKTSDGFFNYGRKDYDDSALGSLRYLRLPPCSLSNFHDLDGNITEPLDVTGNFGTTYPLKNNIRSLVDYVNSGSSRPKINTVGFCFFDTTLNKPIYWTGAKWVDANGASV